MAAIARIQPSFKNPKEYFNINANGTLNISEYCSKNNIPLIYAGSSSHHSGKFKNPYTFSKDIGEEIIKLYQEHFNLQSSIVRFYNVYGPHQLVEGGYTTLIGKWLNNIKNGLPCEIYGDGEKRRDFTHVDDIVDGLIRVQKYNKYGHIFELGRGKNYSINEVADMWGLEVFHIENKLGEAQETLADYSLAKELLNWKPKINLEDYLKTL
jgi:nucleoside-diphosphate-sugar epimerase